jgi:hypothetical protein
MQCPTCGYDGIHEEACFCPRCRYQFQVPDNDVMFEDNLAETPFQTTVKNTSGEKFSGKEIRQLKVQLLQPACILMIALATVIYLSSPRINELSNSVSGIEFHYGGAVSFIVALVLTWIFYRLMIYWFVRN